MCLPTTAGSRGGAKGKAAARAAASSSPLLDLLVLAHQPRSRLLLIGIANDLNLVQRVMPEVVVSFAT